ncbi:MAG: proton-conducting transporter membrane subunit [Candidatus Micrarchaeaceae archaeon]
MFVLLILLPLFFAIILIQFLKQELSKYIAIVGTLISLIMFPFITQEIFSINILSIGKYIVSFATNVLPLNLMLLGIVLIIAPLIILYSFGYMTVRSEQKRFYTEILAFEISMLLFSVSYSFITLFIAWEFLSLTSYLLIGFWNTREKANYAARKAITTVFIGDICILGVIAILLSTAGTLTFNQVFAFIKTNQSLAVFIAALFAIAIFTKSAQFPFSEWLPDAMEGPTPVSAFLHSSTMVKAGVFSILLLFPIFYASNLLGIIFVIAAITVFLATLNALKEKHIKKVIAYSTIQELGLMMLAFAGGAIPAGIYFFFAQSFYKVLLFFSAGVIMDATGKINLDETSGLKVNKVIYITTIFGILSLAGFIPFDGFFASIGLTSSFFNNIIIYIILNVFGLMTSLYSFRWLFLNSKNTTPYAKIKYKSISKSIQLSMIISSLLILVASVSFFYLIKPVLGSSYNNFTFQNLNFIDVILETILAISGLIIAYFAVKKSVSIKSANISKLINNGIIINTAYKYIVNGIYILSEGFNYFEEELTYILDSFGRGIVDLSKIVRKVSVGDINSYAVILSIGIILLFLFIFILKGV